MNIVNVVNVVGSSEIRRDEASSSAPIVIRPSRLRGLLPAVAVAKQAIHA